MDDNHPALIQLRAALDSGQIDQALFESLAAAFRQPGAVSAQADSGAAIANGPQAQALAQGAIQTGDNASGILNSGTLIQYITAGKQPGASAEVLRKAYLARLMQDCDQVSLMAGDPRTEALRLSQVYTALLTNTRRSQIESAQGTGSRLRKLLGEGAFIAPFLSAIDQLNQHTKLILLGDPGGGKSSVVQMLALTMAGEALNSPHANLERLRAPVQRIADEKKPESQPWDHGALLPVRVLLRELAAHLPERMEDIDANTVLDHLQRQLQSAGLAAFFPHLAEELLERGGLILLDGLDEVPDAQQRRVRIKRAVECFASTYQGCRYLATSRTYAYRNQDWKLHGFAEAQLLPFQPWQIEAFITAWYAQMMALQRLTEAEAEDRTERLRHEAQHSPHLRELAERPLLLTLIAKLQTETGGELPERPEQLYDRAVELLLDTWERSKPRGKNEDGSEPEPSLAAYLQVGRERIRKVLDRLAFEAHRDQSDSTGCANIDGGALVTALLAAAADPDAKPARLTEYLSHRAGLLNEQDNGIFQFPHRSFQEYLAACHLTNDDFPNLLAHLAKQDPQRWREVVRLAAAKACRGSGASVWLLAETLCPAPVAGDPGDTTPDLPVTEAWGALLAGQVLTENVDLDDIAPRDFTKHERIRDWQLALLRRRALPSFERALAGRNLSRLGDPRPEVMTLDGMQFCYVPTGPFWMGDDSKDDARPIHQVDLQAYWIGRYPVTTAQWREYVRESGRQPDDNDSLGGDGNAPAIWVSWGEALAFCDWLSVRWAAQLPAGWRVALPSEAEWEKAARGGTHHLTQPPLATVSSLTAHNGLSMVVNSTPQRCYPWGDEWGTECANTSGMEEIDDKLSIGGVSATGTFPLGRSPCGAEELIGNIWEWTRSIWRADFGKPTYGYPYPDALPQREDQSVGSRKWHILRGGAWDVSSVVARCALRFWLPPNPPKFPLGFRVVLRCPPAR